MNRKILMTDVGFDLQAIDVLAPKKGKRVKGVRALMSKRRSHPVHGGNCACAACQAR